MAFSGEPSSGVDGDARARARSPARRALVLASAAIAAAASLPACDGAAGPSAGASAPAPRAETTGASSAPLSSLTARERDLSFTGVVYVAAGASDAAIAAAIADETRSALGALRASDVAPRTRELADVPPSAWTRTPVDVVDPAHPTGAPARALHVQYTYTDRALVPRAMPVPATLDLALLAPGVAATQADVVLGECTANDPHAREFATAVWYVFDPSLPTCAAAIAAESARIAADRARAGLTHPATEVTLSETTRRYVPTSFTVAGDHTSDAVAYPEYDRLYAGGVLPDHLVVGMVDGLLADWAAGTAPPETIDDPGYVMWLRGIRTLVAARPTLHLVAIEPAEDLSTIVWDAGAVVDVGIERILAWEIDHTRFPPGLSDAQIRGLRIATAKKVARHWLTFDAPVTVTVGAAAPRPFTVRVATYFGAGTDRAPHARGLGTSDVFVYNGHSYIGEGPLDPSTYAPGDLPPTYQLFFVNACISYNYDEAGYFALKGGTKNLDVVTNGLETPIAESGEDAARFVAALIDGAQHPYPDLLRAGQFVQYTFPWGRDALRVVDGETDNTYDPAVTPIVVADAP